MGKEPLLIIGAAVVGLNAFQAAALSLPAWAHAAIAAVTAGLGFVVARSQVTPTARPAAKPVARRHPSHRRENP